MRKSTLLQIFGVIALVAILSVSARAFFAARSQVSCALRILGSAPPGDQSPPATYGRLAQAEWGRPPADLDEREMTWLFVIGQVGPGCSRQRGLSEPGPQVCASRYQSLLAELPRLHSSALR